MDEPFRLVVVRGAMLSSGGVRLRRTCHRLLSTRLSACNTVARLSARDPKRGPKRATPQPAFSLRCSAQPTACDRAPGAKVHLNGKRPTLRRMEKIYARYGKWKNKVWWYEHWLTWGTARSIVREAGLEPNMEAG